MRQGRAFQTERVTYYQTLEWIGVRCITATRRRSVGGGKVSQGDISTMLGQPVQKLVNLKFGGLTWQQWQVLVEF